MTKKMTRRERFAQYNFAECEQGATIEQNWRLIKDEPISDKHKGLEDAESHVVLIESDTEMSNFAPCEGGRLYKMPDGTAFRCIYKLTPNSTDGDGNPTGYPVYYNGTMYRDGQECPAEWLTVTNIKDRLFGKQGWTSQKGPRVQNAPRTEAEARALAETWGAELIGHIEAVERILGTYRDKYSLMPEFSLAKRICKFRARKHSEALLEEYRAQQKAEKVELKAKSNTRKADKLGEVSAEDMLAILAAKGITLEQLMAAQK